MSARLTHPYWIELVSREPHVGRALLYLSTFVSKEHLGTMALYKDVKRMQVS